MFQDKRSTLGLVPIKPEGAKIVWGHDRNRYHLYVNKYLTDNEAWWFLPEKQKPKLSAKFLAYLSPLLPILGIIKNNSMGKREFFNPWNWVK